MLGDMHLKLDKDIRVNVNDSPLILRAHKSQTPTFLK